MSYSDRLEIIGMDEPMPDIVAELYANAEVVAGKEFHSRFGKFSMAALQLIRASAWGGGCKVTRTQHHLKSAPADFLFACLPLEGETRLDQSGRACILSPGDLGLLDTQAQFSVEVPDCARTLWLQIDRVQFDTRIRDLAGCTARRINGAVGLGLVASRFIRSTMDELRNLPHERTGDLARIMIDLVASACAEAGGIAPIADQSAGRLTYERACKYIDENLWDERLSRNKIAAGVNISTRYLSEIFASEGQTPMGYLAQRRLARCYAELQYRQWSPGIISKVAFDNGYSNLSSFNRSFKQFFGRCPRDTMVGGDPTPFSGPPRVRVSRPWSR